MIHSAETIASARESLGDLWLLLRPGLWHSTRPARYRAILNDGEIRPDGGQGGNVYRGSFAASIGAVSLFDFENASEEEALGTHWKWATHLWPGFDTRLTVLIGLNRNVLPGRLILAKEGGELAMREQKNWYPRVEACHIGPVPANAFNETFAIRPGWFELLPSGPAGLPCLDELVEQCPEHPDAELVRILDAARDRAGRGHQ